MSSSAVHIDLKQISSTHVYSSLSETPPTRLGSEFKREMGRHSSPALLLVAGWLRSVAAHGAVTHPKPRQAIDGSLAPWNGSVPDPVPFDTPN